MDFPAEVRVYFQDSFVKDSRPICFRISSDYTVNRSWGEGEWCGLDVVEAGSNLLDRAPYLFGLLDGSSVTVDFLSTPNDNVVNVHTIPAGDDEFYVVILDVEERHREIRERQQAVNELRLLHASQQRLISRQRDLISELVEARAELDHIQHETARDNRNKGRFIAMMSHEFRTPLASILNYAELAQDADADDDSIRKCLETIDRSARHLNSLVDAILDDARLDAGQVELSETEFNLHEMLQDLSAMMAPLAAEKELAFACLIDTNVPQVIVADSIKLRQILINLVGNAIKFTTEGGITVTTTYAEGRLVSAVEDTGPGISVEDQERVFQAFERGASPSDKGAGLGLTISLRLAKLMNGEISLDSKLGHGCTVAVNLPVSVRRAAKPVLAPPSAESQVSQSVSVLVCDDDEDMLALLEFYLHRAGYGLIVCENATDAVAKALAYDPDVVLMDCNLPEMSGIDAAKKLRAGGYSKPVVALTASKLSENELQEFSAYVRKGTSMQSLLEQLKRLTHEAR